MRILCINTAFSNSDVALLFDEKKASKTLPSSAKQSENILVAVDELLVSSGVKISDIDIFSCVVGPGSFTGVRIGTALIKGMKLAKSDCKLVSVCSLDLMAHIASERSRTETFWCVINALSGNIFACSYDKSGNRLSNPKMFEGDELDQIFGTVFGLRTERMEIATEFVDFDADSLLDYSICLANQGKFCEENMFLPIYLRKSQAESQLDNKHGN